MNTDSKNRKTRDETPTNNILRRKPAQRSDIEIDVDHYQAIIDDPGVSAARKRELIAIIGRIVVQFIDIGFDVHPVQLAQEKQADKNERLKHTSQVEKERQNERRAERIDA